MDLFFRCARCGAFVPAADLRWHCPCGGLFEPKVFRDGELPAELPASNELGTYATPLLARSRFSTAEQGRLYIKNDGVLPTGSYKDRGARTLLQACHELGVRSVVEDSSGNAGAAIAAYAAALGIAAEIFVKQDAAPGKVRQIRAYGAKVTRVRGSREDVARATSSRLPRTRVTFAPYARICRTFPGAASCFTKISAAIPKAAAYAAMAAPALPDESSTTERTPSSWHACSNVRAPRSL